MNRRLPRKTLLRSEVGLAILSGLAALAAAWLWSTTSKAAGDRAGCERASFEGAQFVFCRYAPHRDRLELQWQGRDAPLGSLSKLQVWLGPKGSRVHFAMNAGMFDPEQRPLGLFVQDGHEVRPLNAAKGGGNFFLLPNGVFWVGADGTPHIDETTKYATAGNHPQWATQSGPLLVAANELHPKVAENGASLLIRNGVGVRHGEAVFAISEQPVSFGRFARFMRDAQNCPDVLYLDGVVSSLWAPSMGRQDTRTGLGPFVVVLKRQAGGDPG